MQEALLTALQERGMSDKEAKIYLTTLELWSAPASSIARKSGIKRVTAYFLLKEMEKKWLASSLEKEGVLYFHVVSPKTLQRSLETKASSFKEHIPALLAATDTYNNKPKIEYYDGMSWIKTMYELLLESQTGICSFVWYNETNPQLHDYLMNEFLPQRVQKQIFAQVILSPSEANEHYVWLDKEAHKESVVVDHEVFSITASEINIYGPDKVMFALFAWDELSGVVIHSKKLYESMRSIFDLLWLTHNPNHPWTK